MLLEKTWLRVIGAALSAVVAYLWIVHGLSFRAPLWHALIVAVLAGGAAWMRVRKQPRQEEANSEEDHYPRRYSRWQ